MLQSDEQWLAIADEFYCAAVDQSRWYGALERLAAATGSRTGELITIGRDAVVPINIMTNMDPAIHAAAAACRIGDPEINPRVKAGMTSPVLKVMAESDFLAPGEHAVHPHYDEFARPWDIPFICLATLERQDDLLIGLAVLRSEREGHIDAGQRNVFASLAPHVRAAVRMQIALEGNGASLVRGALDTLSIPAFVCGRSGAVLAVTTSAEEILRSDCGLSLRDRFLHAFRDDDDKALNDAIGKVALGLAQPGAPAVTTVVVRGADATKAPIVLDVMSLPSIALEFSSAPRVVVVARGSRGGDARKATLLQGVYGFTSAETDIALQLARGQSTEIIAQQRKVAVGTVRAQIKSMLAKLGVSRQVELVARLTGF
ncbi:MAG TPA: helix-turn-helix transcriptional regulator [Steroidobacteraceae bacterium]|nr:helix-turn-helix transcriptional regulator [Steroidobacteraceae bacterium]